MSTIPTITHLYFVYRPRRRRADSPAREPPHFGHDVRGGIQDHRRARARAPRCRHQRAHGEGRIHLRAGVYMCVCVCVYK